MRGGFGCGIRRRERLSRIDIYRGEMNPLASNHIHCLFVDSSGYLWVGTNAGLDQYDKRTGRFDHFTVQDGLSGKYRTRNP